MQRRIDGEFTHWTARITIRKAVRDEIRVLAREETRSTASMIGTLLTEAVTARSSA